MDIHQVHTHTLLVADYFSFVFSIILTNRIAPPSFPPLHQSVTCTLASFYPPFWCSLLLLYPPSCLFYSFIFIPSSPSSPLCYSPYTSSHLLFLLYSSFPLFPPCFNTSLHPI